MFGGGDLLLSEGEGGGEGDMQGGGVPLTALGMMGERAVWIVCSARTARPVWKRNKSSNLETAGKLNGERINVKAGFNLCIMQIKKCNYLCNGKKAAE